MRLAVLLVLCAMTFRLLHLFTSIFSVCPSMKKQATSNVHLLGYISHLYCASPQCANTKGLDERVEAHLRTQTILGMPIIIWFFSHPWLCALRMQLSMRPEVTCQTQSRLVLAPYNTVHGPTCGDSCGDGCAKHFVEADSVAGSWTCTVATYFRGVAVDYGREPEVIGLHDMKRGKENNNYVM